jgi:hypothetical protein
MPAPTSATLSGERIALRPLAEAVAKRYFDEFPEDLGRYGEAARAWEIHDTSHCLQWAILDAEGLVSLEREIAWLTTVLGARDFPLEQLARNLEIAAEVVEAALAESGPAIGSRLRAAAADVRYKARAAIP